MKEDFLQFAWKFRQFSTLKIFTTDGQPVDVLKTGRQNSDAGPDFLDARLRIGDTVWAGNVEVHLTASDWRRHGHHNDPAYDNVILHVVYNHDADIKNGKGQVIPTLSLRELIDYQTYRYYKSWLKSAGYIPCDPANRAVSELVKTSAVQAASVERLRRKSALCLDHLNETRGDVESTFYRVLLRAFGLKVNAIPFEQLAKTAPMALVRKLRTDRADLDALFLGQAGFLNENAAEGDGYVADLRKRYDFLRRKHSLHSMPLSAWKLFRLRPSNFPQIRLAQLAQFYHQRGDVARRMLETKSLEEIRNLFDVALDDGFWLTHYTLDKESTPKKKVLGASAVDLLIVNAVVPFMFALSQYNKDESFRERAMALLEDLPPENNAVVRKFGEMGFVARSALDSQGIVQLKQFDCENRKCLFCKVGIQLLKGHGKV